MSKRVTRIDELARNVPPTRDLWPAIAAAIDADKIAMAQAVPTRRPAWLPAAGMAAAVALVALGFVIGRQSHTSLPTTASTTTTTADPSRIPAALRDQEYRAQRALLMVEVQDRLRTMAPADRDKVAASLNTLQRSITDIEAALGRDPANALLQELLVNSCQEEMRALTAVRDSGNQES